MLHFDRSSRGAGNVVFARLAGTSRTDPTLISTQVTGGIGTEPCDLILNCAIRACAEAHHWQVS